MARASIFNQTPGGTFQEAISSSQATEALIRGEVRVISPGVAPAELVKLEKFVMATKALRFCGSAGWAMMMEAERNKAARHGMKNRSMRKIDEPLSSILSPLQ